MALISLRQLLDHAAENDYGVPAFNINNMEQVPGIMRAADPCDAPVILQASRGARNYAGTSMIRHPLAAALEMYPHIPIVLHRDHGNNAGQAARIKVIPLPDMAARFTSGRLDPKISTAAAA